MNNLIKAKLAARPNSVVVELDVYIRALDDGDVNSPLWLPTDTTHMSPTGYPHQETFLVRQVIDTPPSVEGAIAQTVPAVTSSASASSTPPDIMGAIAQIVPAVASAASATIHPPGMSGSIAAGTPAVTTTAAGAMAPPGDSGESARQPPPPCHRRRGIDPPGGITGVVAAVTGAVQSEASATIDRGASRMVFIPPPHRSASPAIRPRPLSPPIWPPA